MRTDVSVDAACLLPSLSSSLRGGVWSSCLSRVPTATRSPDGPAGGRWHHPTLVAQLSRRLDSTHPRSPRPRRRRGTSSVRTLDGWPDSAPRQGGVEDRLPAGPGEGNGCGSATREHQGRQGVGHPLEHVLAVAQSDRIAPDRPWRPTRRRFTSARRRSGAQANTGRRTGGGSSPRRRTACLRS